VGEITHLSGRILDFKGDPIRDAEVEIWQVDHNAVYLAERDHETKADLNFQGFGRFLTSSTGEYYFRTIKPVPYPGRLAPHIHFKIRRKGEEPWTTQLFIKGYPDNGGDGVYQGIGSTRDQETVTRAFVPIKESTVGELAARFDIIPGATSRDHGHHGPPPAGNGYPPVPPLEPLGRSL
jgi:protocatechuate 3,4-dioxygenase beta subunit